MVQSTISLVFEAAARRLKRLTAEATGGGGIRIAVVFGCNLLILLTQPQPLLI
jgi:hypothetical protein